MLGGGVFVAEVERHAPPFVIPCHYADRHSVKDTESIWQALPAFKLPPFVEYGKTRVICVLSNSGAVSYMNQNWQSASTKVLKYIFKANLARLLLHSSLSPYIINLSFENFSSVGLITLYLQSGCINRDWSHCLNICVKDALISAWLGSGAICPGVFLLKSIAPFFSVIAVIHSQLLGKS